jgi:hypothetical protein
MKFFLPVQETKVAEESYQAIKKFIEKQTGWPVSDKRYYEIHYRHNDQDLHVRVGGPDPLNGEQVFAIFKPQNPSSTRQAKTPALGRGNTIGPHAIRGPIHSPLVSR